MAKNRNRPEEDEEGREQLPTKPRGSRLVWFASRLLVLLLLLGVLAFFAPMLLATTGAWKSVLASSAPKLADKIDVKSLSLSWFSKIELKGVAVRDAAGQPLAQVARVSSRKTLLEIALNYHDLGTFDVESPQARWCSAQTAATSKTSWRCFPSRKKSLRRLRSAWQSRKARSSWTTRLPAASGK